MQSIEPIVKKTALLAALLFFAVLLYTISRGVYFLGDTVSYMEYGSLGGPLTTFIQHDGLWPPLFALLFNGIYRLALSPFMLSSVWVIVVLVAYVGAVLLVLNKLHISTKKGLTLAALTATGPLTLLFQAQLSEPLMLVFWVASLLAVLAFWRTEKEHWLAVFLISGSLLPLSRWLGAMVLVWLSAILFYKVASDWCSKKKMLYSPLALVLTLVLVWIPIGFYLFKSKVLIGSYFPARDIQTTQTLLSMLYQYGAALLQQGWVSTAAAFLIGLGLSHKKKNRLTLPAAIVILGSAVVYLLGLAFSESRYVVLPYMPFRYVGISLPFIILASLLFGSYLAPQIQKRVGKTAMRMLSSSGYALAAILIGVSIYSTGNRLLLEQQATSPFLPYAGWTGDFKTFCNPTNRTVVIYHPHTRNWGARSYTHLCDTAHPITEGGTTAVSEGETVVSAYAIAQEQLLLEKKLTVNDYDTYIYVVRENTVLDVATLFEERSRFE